MGGAPEIDHFDPSSVGGAPGGGGRGMVRGVGGPSGRGGGSYRSRGRGGFNGQDRTAEKEDGKKSAIAETIAMMNKMKMEDKDRKAAHQARKGEQQGEGGSQEGDGAAAAGDAGAGDQSRPYVHR